MGVTALTAIVFSVALPALTAVAQSSTEKFFAGKDLNFVIGGAPGGGYSIYSLALSRHLGKHLPGHPNIIARNEPGAGSIKASTSLYALYPKDGSTFGAIMMGAVVEPLIGTTPSLKYDPNQFSYIGSANQEVSLCVAWNTSPIKTFKDVFDKQMIVSSSGGSSIDQYPRVLNNVLGTKFKVVSGYPGSHESALAVERGEVEGLCGIQYSSFITSYRRWLDEKKAHIIVQIGSEEGFAPLNEMGVPKIWDFVKTEEQRKTLKTIFAQLEFGRPYVLPPGVPADRVAAYRKAFDETMKDPAFLADAKKLNLDINPLSGAKIQEIVSELYETSPALVEKAKAALK
jgi:tripartite-type tricarboxylate transporter receptor subunit TctC